MQTESRFKRAMDKVVTLWRTKHCFDPRIMDTLEYFRTDISFIIEDVYGDKVEPDSAAWVFVAEMSEDIDYGIKLLESKLEPAN